MTEVYKFSQLDNFNSTDLDVLFRDSLGNSQVFTQLLNLLKLSHVSSIDYVRMSGDLEIYYAGTTKKELVLSYLRLGIWKLDELFERYAIFRFKIIDYQKDTRIERVMLDNLGLWNTLTIVIENHSHTFKDSFSFEISREYFLKLEKMEIVQLYEQLKSVVYICYSRVYLHTAMQLPSALRGQNKLSKREDIIKNDVLKFYQINALHLEYLGYIAACCTAKEIAKHMNKSYRTVQSSILRLCVHFQVETKAQLQQIARIIVSQAY